MLSTQSILPTALAASAFGLLATLTGALGANPGSGTATASGKKIYNSRCASCHGANGEGTKAYSRPLTGSRSLAELTQFVTKSMPPGPRKWAGTDVASVSSYLYDTFYSPIAQARNRPARIALSRLTVRQFRNSVCDLIGSFREGGRPNERHGLRGQYYKSSRMRDSDRIADRTDAEVMFDYGIGCPLKEQTDPYQFAMRWEGSVLAPDTGEYEFVVHTEHAMSLWVNDVKKPLIDAEVKSGSDNEYRASLFLLAGHLYPLRLDFSKGVTGVDNIAKVKEKPPAKASISLEWKRPKQPSEVIPSRCLFPTMTAESYVPSTPFPPDDRSIGYERGTSVSKAWDEATTSAALDAAGYVLAHLRELSGAAEGAPDRESKVKAFCRQLVERAFRRPLTEEVAQNYVDRQLKLAPSLDTGVKRVILLTLLSPRFLYREAGATNPDSFDVASRLSFGLWDSLPDQELLKAASTGHLASREQVVAQGERMVADPRAWFKVREFLLQWLKVDQVPDLAKDSKRFPGFDAAVAADLRSSLELFLETTAWGEKSDFRQLMTAIQMPLNGRLARVYGVNLPADAPFQPATLDSGSRCGVLTHPYMLASFAYIDNSSPIHRGVLIARNMLGRVLQPPPAAFTPLSADLHPNLTTRQRVALQTKPAACTGCHGLINPLGFTLEHYDAVGRLREKENDQPIDASALYQTRDGKTVRFDGAKDLAKYIAESPESHAAFVEKLFQYLVKQPVRAYGANALPALEKSFEQNECSIRKLVVESMALSTLQK